MKKNKKEREEEEVNEEVAIGSRKLSANEQFFVGAQTVVVAMWRVCSGARSIIT